MASSMSTGGTFSPPAVMINSLIRPVIYKKEKKTRENKRRKNEKGRKIIETTGEEMKRA